MRPVVSVSRNTRREQTGAALASRNVSRVSPTNEQIKLVCNLMFDQEITNLCDYSSLESATEDAKISARIYFEQNEDIDNDKMTRGILSLST